MSSAEPPILIDARLRAMLLWEEPWLWSQDGGAEQWLQVLRLEFPRVGMLEHEDALSLAAHLARAGMLDDAATARSLRAQLEAIGDTGRLLAGLISLWLDLEDRDRTAGTLEEVRQLIDRVEDEDVRARLLLRLSAFARRAAMPDTARDALVAMITVTDTSTRLGVVARRAAAAQGIEVPEFNPVGDGYARGSAAEPAVGALKRTRGGGGAIRRAPRARAQGSLGLELPHRANEARRSTCGPRAG